MLAGKNIKYVTLWTRPRLKPVFYQIFLFFPDSWPINTNFFRLPFKIVEHKCVRIKDPRSQHWSIVIAFGLVVFQSGGTETESGTALLWDLETDELGLVDPSGQQRQFYENIEFVDVAEELSEYQVINIFKIPLLDGFVYFLLLETA
jgi:hypothetical protein